jgi:phage FluMu protein Com
MSETPQPRKFLGVQFVRCRTYGRLYMNKDGSAYEGRCPRCGQYYKIAIGKGGTSERFFVAECRNPKIY